MNDSPVLWLPEDGQQKMIGFASAEHPLETGGVMLGYANPPHVVVTEIIGPGPSAKHYRYRFIPDAAYQQAAIEAHFERTEGGETYLGDWHTHPNGIARMSWLDKLTLARIAQRTEGLAVLPSMAILAGGAGRWELAAFHHVKKAGILGLRFQQPKMRIKEYKRETRHEATACRPLAP